MSDYFDEFLDKPDITPEVKKHLLERRYSRSEESVEFERRRSSVQLADIPDSVRLADAERQREEQLANSASPAGMSKK